MAWSMKGVESVQRTFLPPPLSAGALANRAAGILMSFTVCSSRVSNPGLCLQLGSGSHLCWPGGSAHSCHPALSSCCTGMPASSASASRQQCLQVPAHAHTGPHPSGPLLPTRKWMTTQDSLHGCLFQVPFFFNLLPGLPILPYLIKE